MLVVYIFIECFKKKKMGCYIKDGWEIGRWYLLDEVGI